MSKILDVVMVQLQNLWIWFNYTDFGGEIRSNSKCLYPMETMEHMVTVMGPYLIGTNFAYIGLGKEVDNDPTQVIQAQETTELNGARVYFNSVDPQR